MVTFSGITTLSETLPLMVQTTDFGFYCSSFNGSFKIEACESVRPTSILLTESDG